MKPHVRARIGTALLLGALWGVAARAADDGGTRSALATGAGSRAIALGGAFSAIADDASATLWNPAGLGRTRRGEAQFGQTTLPGVELRETFAALVWPDWRWGAAALSIRHLGVDGIEGRDDRNRLLEGELSDRQTEVALAYGRRVGEFWSLGAAAKLRRQELAGRSGAGMGVDLGVQVQPARALGLGPSWADDLRLGLAVSNAVEPSIRLDQESVPDPSTLRTGLALERGLAAGTVRLGLDIEKTHGARARLHTGVEMVPHPQLALRGGLGAGTLTAGAGFGLRDLVLDYAFEDLPTGASHRAGLTWRFGSTVDDARAAAARAEEERLQARLAEVERQRQAERVALLLLRAEEARAGRRLDEALELLTTVRALDSTDAGARALQASCLTERARAIEDAGDPAAAAVAYARALEVTPGDTALAGGLARCRTASDLRARRTAAVREAFARALDAFASDDLSTARAGLEAILVEHPDDSEARSLLRRVEQAIARRAETMLRQARSLLQAGSVAEASAWLSRARALDPRAAGLAELEALAARAAARAEPSRISQAAAGAPRPLTPQQQREVADLYRRGLAAMEQGRVDDALRYWELVRAMQPGYQRVDHYLKREYLTRGMDLFAAGRLDEAVVLWQRALRIDPNDPRALGYLARAHEQQARAREISGDER